MVKGVLMHRLKGAVTAGLVALLLLGSCDFRPLDHDRADAWYEFAVSCLDVFFIFRDRLPSDLYAFRSPQDLYAAVHEPFTVFLDPSEAYERFADLTTQRGGIGIKIDSVAEGYVIEKVYPNTPGETAGLKALDTILRVGDQSLEQLSIEKTIRALQGEIGTEALLRIKRGGNRINITVIRGVFMLPSVEVDSLDSTTAYIMLGGFYHETTVAGGSAAEFSDALDRTAWAKYTILDLRENRGGYIDQCVSIVGDLVPPETPIVRIHERTYSISLDRGVTSDTVFLAGGTGKASGRILYILVDDYTASASEMLVSCLREREQVTVVGTNTYGKGRGQIMIDGPDSVLAVVTCMTISPASDTAALYDSIGIVPDVSTGDSSAYDVALEMIGGLQLSKRRLQRGPHRPGRRDADPFAAEPAAVFVRRP